MVCRIRQGARPGAAARVHGATAAVGNPRPARWAPRRRMGVWGCARDCAPALALGVAVAAPAAAAPGEGWAFTRLEAGALGEAVAALAPGPQPGSLTIGDARGVGVLARDGGRRRLLHRGPVRDLVFLPASLAEPGELLVASADGLWRVTGAGAGASVAPGPGAAARDVHRVATAGGLVAAATSAGVFVSADARRWRHPSPRLPRSEARTVALRARGDTLECFTVLGDQLWRLLLAAGPSGPVALRVEREHLPVRRGAEGPVDVVFGLAGSDTVAVLADAFVVRERPGGAWRAVLPALPPGARARRLLEAHGRLWLATDRGLLVARGLAGPWDRAPGPAGRSEVRALASDGAGVYAGAGDAIWRVRTAAAASGSPTASQGVAVRITGAAALRTPEGDPPIEHVQRAALAHLSLGTQGVAGLRRGVARRGWLPIVSLRFARNRDEDRIRDHDEAFLSGDVRRTLDRERRSARDFESSLSFSWDLGDVLYHPEQIDVSREARELIKLRDDVLDELNQLYFERRRVVSELATRPGAPAAERLRLQLRAAELAAGLDAWTGGWFSRARAGAP